MLKCDIRKFFASIDQTILLKIVCAYISDPRIKDLITEVVGSFQSNPRITLVSAAAEASVISRKGLPLGNLTSQLLINVYMNEFDRYMKHALKTKYYIRYADDFVILSNDRQWLEKIERYIALFLRERLKLELHPDKVSISTFASGDDFLGWIHSSDHRVLRTSTKRRMLRRVYGLDKENPATQSYLGMLRHGNAYDLSKTISRL